MAGVDPCSRAAYSQIIYATFDEFREELDQHHDVREVIVKTSRDITALSKKAIFALHRITTRPPEAVFAEAGGKVTDIVGLFKSIAPHVQQDNFYRQATPAWNFSYRRYSRSLSPGIQEFIEAVSFLHFLRNHSLVTLADVQSLLVDLTAPNSDPYVIITPDDYALGLADLTGELMRYAINAIGAGQPAVAIEAAAFVRALKADFDPLVPSVRSLGKKMGTMQSSLRKMEDASYAIKIRGAEYGESSERLLDYIRRLTASEDAVERVTALDGNV